MAQDGQEKMKRVIQIIYAIKDGEREREMEGDEESLFPFKKKKCLTK